MMVLTYSLATVSISKHVRYIHGRQYTLVDTPGFNDTFRSDSEVLKQLVEWLYSTYTSGTKLRGILYIHRITEVRMQGSSLSNLKTFKQLCGESYFKCITLGTSCWSTVTETTGRNREIELQENSQFWKPLLSRGARYSRLPDDFSAACDLVTSMCGHDHNRTTKPQVIRELDAGTTFSNLSAIKTLESYELETQRKRHEEDMRRIKAEQEAKARAQEEGRRLRLEIAQWEQQNRMIEHHLSLRNRCSGNKPHGKCDRCGSRLWQWAVVFREFPTTHYLS